METIRCTKCEKDKPSEQYQPQKNFPEKLYKWCDPCRLAPENVYVPKDNPSALKPQKERLAALDSRYTPMSVQDSFMDGHSNRAAAYGCEGADEDTRFTWAEWMYLRKFYGDKCLKCGKHAHIQADHVIPLAAGGANRWDNIQLLCRRCNFEKKATTADYRQGRAPKSIPKKYQGIYYRPYPRSNRRAG